MIDSETKFHKELVEPQTVILFEPKTPIPGFLMRPEVTVDACVLGCSGRKVMRLSILKGEASFMPGGVVDVKIGRRGFWTAFDRMIVLVIYTRDEVPVRNHYMCRECGLLKGCRIYEESCGAGSKRICMICPESHTWNIKLDKP